MAETLPEPDSLNHAQGEEDGEENHEWGAPHEVEAECSKESMAADPTSCEEADVSEYDEPTENLVPGAAVADEGIHAQESAVGKEEPLVPLRKIPLAGESIQIDALADLLGIKAYEVLRDLIKMEIFAKPTDLISAVAANEISMTYGYEILPGVSSPPKEKPIDGDKTRHSDFRGRRTFKVNTSLSVSAGDWIRDSVLGMGRILKLNTHPEKPDRHRVWFIGQTEYGTIIEEHPILPNTLGKIDESMVPADIRDAAPEIDQFVTD